jgi:hypothetical protein
MLYFLVSIESGQIITTLFHIQMQLQVNCDVIKIDKVIIEHNHNGLVTTMHKNSYCFNQIPNCYDYSQNETCITASTNFSIDFGR